MIDLGIELTAQLLRLRTVKRHNKVPFVCRIHAREEVSANTVDICTSFVANDEPVSSNLAISLPSDDAVLESLTTTNC